MNNIEQLKKKLKNFKLTRLICIITLTIAAVLIPITAPKSTAIATIFLVIAIISIIIGLILDKKIKEYKKDIKQITIIKKGIEDSK